MKEISICVVGVGNFARPFIRCYQKHPLVKNVFICARNEKNLSEQAEKLGISKESCFTDFDSMLKDKRIDAVHILTPTFDHYNHQLKALRSNKCVACAVSMGETVEQLRGIVDAKRQTGKTYMLMETSFFSRDVFKVKKLISTGRFGRVQGINCSHMQSSHLLPLEKRWEGYPPLLYGSHACAPAFAIIGTEAKSVVCFGSGEIDKKYQDQYGCRDAIQTAMVTFKNSDVCATIQRCMYNVLREPREHFDCYGSLMSYEWEQLFGDGAAIHFGSENAVHELTEDFTDGLPDSLIFKGEKKAIGNWLRADCDTEEFALRIGYYGAIPHLVNEFVAACSEGRASAIDAEAAANMTAVGILAVESARQGGRKIDIPEF